MTKLLEPLETVAAVVEKLDGSRATAELVGGGISTSTVLSWKHREKFPARTFVVLQDEIQKRGFCAPKELWGM